MSDTLTHKFVAVLNKKIEPGKQMNALAHSAAGLVGLFPEVKELRFDTYIDADGGAHKSISDHPFIILVADNSSKLNTFREGLLERELPFTDFTSTMTVGSFAEQKARTLQTPSAELEYYCVCTFGPAAVLQELTRKFSLYR